MFFRLLSYSLFYRLKCGVQGGNQIFRLLDSYGKTDRIRFDSLIEQFFFRELRMSRACRMDDQRFDIRHIGKQGKDRQMINEFLSGLGAAFDLKGED